jgi:hypothetical protein
MSDNWREDGQFMYPRRLTIEILNAVLWSRKYTPDMLDAIHMNPNTFWTHDGLRSRCKSTNSLDLRIEKAVCFVFYAASRLSPIWT